MLWGKNQSILLATGAKNRMQSKVFVLVSVCVPMHTHTVCAVYRITEVLGHHEPLVQVQWSLACSRLYDWCDEHHSSQRYIPIWCSMIVVQSTVYHAGPKSPTGVQLGWDLVSAKATAHDSYHFYPHQTIQWPLKAMWKHLFMFLWAFLHVFLLICDPSLCFHPNVVQILQEFMEFSIK